MKTKKFNLLLRYFHQDLKGLNNFTNETVQTYLSCILTYERFCREKLHIVLLQTQPEHLLEFMLDLRKSLSQSRLTQFRAALRRFWRMLELYGEIDVNPAKNLLSIKRSKSKRYNYIPADTVLALIKAIDQTTEKETERQKALKKRDKLMFLLLWCLGLRSGELRAVKKEDVHILDPRKKSALLTVHGKGAKERALLIMDKLFDRVVEFIVPLRPDDLLFPGSNNRSMDNSSLNRRIKKYARLTGIDTPVSPHCLRHCFATEMYYADVPLEAIRVMMGHESLRETSIYIHVSKSDMSASLNLLSITPERRI